MQRDFGEDNYGLEQSQELSNRKRRPKDTTKIWHLYQKRGKNTHKKKGWCFCVCVCVYAVDIYLAENLLTNAY